MLKEIRCSMCNQFYNTSEKMPIALNNCTHNVCQACFISYNEEGKCPFDGKPFSFDKIMINKKLLELITYLIENNLIESESQEEEIEEQIRKEKKEKEEKINLKIDLLKEYISSVTTNFYLEDKEQEIIDWEKYINDDYKENKNKLSNLFKNTKNKYINSKNKEKTLMNNIKNNYYQYNINNLNNFKKEINEIKKKHENWDTSIKTFLDEITNDVENVVLKFDSYSEDIDNKIKECEKLSSDYSTFNETYTKLKSKFRSVSFTTNKIGEIQISLHEKVSGFKKRNSSLDSKKNTKKLMGVKNIDTNPNMNNTIANFGNSPLEINSIMGESVSNINSSNIKKVDDNDLNNLKFKKQLEEDINLVSWDINAEKSINDDSQLIPNNNTITVPQESKNPTNDNNNNNDTTAMVDDSFISGLGDLCLGEKKAPQKKLTRDCIVFIKNKLKTDSINCSGYEIGDEGVKKLLEFMIKKNLEIKVESSPKKGPIRYKDLKLSRCGISNDGLNYIKSIMDVCKNTITHINLSRNYIDMNGVNIICSILQKNIQLKDLKLSKNNIPQNGKELIEECIKQNNLSVKLEI